MNSQEQIRKNKTITRLPAFDGVEVYSTLSDVVIKQGESAIYFPFELAKAIVDAINKAAER